MDESELDIKTPLPPLNKLQDAERKLGIKIKPDLQTTSKMKLFKSKGIITYETSQIPYKPSVPTDKGKCVSTKPKLEVLLSVLIKEIQLLTNKVDSITPPLSSV